MSAVETTLHLVRESKLALLVGETGGGTNGNVTSVRVPGGFEFLAEHVDAEDLVAIERNRHRRSSLVDDLR